MTTTLLYWVLMLLLLVVGLWGNWPPKAEMVRPAGVSILLFVLLVLLGWKVYGPALTGGELLGGDAVRFVVVEVAEPAEPDDEEGQGVVGVMHLGVRGAADVAGLAGDFAAAEGTTGSAPAVGSPFLFGGHGFPGMFFSPGAQIGRMTGQTQPLAGARVGLTFRAAVFLIGHPLIV